MAFGVGIVGWRIDSGYLNITRRLWLPVIAYRARQTHALSTWSSKSLVDITTLSESTRSAFGDSVVRSNKMMTTIIQIAVFW